ncbi:hypothetical protein HPB48_000153 [Haemaphysalis longicornis]|uniref:YqaJ viral recombinase domain-containing protein n=1 Tax=Haemaphysalis longicornis TaxID=44386 RepID=A0A9J6GJP7_HAELO|nr:hypothetical protein HPB48_000153 [Haemaphysalis longicornis]
MDIASSATKKRRIDGHPWVSAKKRTSLQCSRPTTDEMAAYHFSLSKSGSLPALLPLTPNFSDAYIPLGTRFPQAALTNLQKDSCPDTWEEVVESCRTTFNELSIDPEVCTLIAAQTKSQAASEKWHRFRTGRVTASNAGAICATSLNKPSKSLLKRICYPDKIHSLEMDWGKKKKASARAAYVEATASHHVKFQCQLSGLHIRSDYPFVAATPDGIISCEGCGDGLLEVKCPFSAKHDTIAEFASNKQLCLVVQGDDARLSSKHHYHYQVQMQMMICKKTYCNFVVWTEKDFFVEIIFLTRNSATT